MASLAESPTSTVNSLCLWSISRLLKRFHTQSLIQTAFSEKSGKNPSIVSRTQSISGPITTFRMTPRASKLR